MNLIKQNKILSLIIEGRYCADKNGIVYSSGKAILGQRITRGGYKMITLCKIPDRLDCLAHQFCYLFFNGSYNPEFQINHKNGNKLDNNLDNLEAITASENQKHSVRVLMNQREQRGEANKMAKLTWENVRAIRKEHSNGVIQRDLAKKYGVTYGNINNIVLNKTWKEKVSV